MNTANATGNPRLTLCGQTSFGLVKQGCRGAEGKRVGEMHGARERWKRDRGEERARERERERKRERRGAAQWPVVFVGLYGPVGAAARAVAGVCSTHLLKHRHKHRQWYRRRHIEYTCTQGAQTQAHMHKAHTHAGAALQW